VVHVARVDHYTVRGYDGSTESGDPVPQEINTGATFGASNGRWWDDCAGTINGTLHLFGGYTGGGSGGNSIFSYDAASNTTGTSAFTMPSNEYWCGATRSQGQLYLLGGGSGSNGASSYTNVFKFGPASVFTTANGTLPTAEYQVAAETLANGTVVAVGGQNGTTRSNTVSRFDPFLDPVGALTTATTLTYPSGAGTVGMSSIDGEPLLAGGNFSGSGAMKPNLRTKELTTSFGPDSATEVNRAAPSSIRMGAGGAALNVFDNRADTWSTLAVTAPTGRMRVTAFRVTGFVYFVGGNTGNTVSLEPRPSIRSSTSSTPAGRLGARRRRRAWQQLPARSEAAPPTTG
jgi:hypothetical protein